MPVVIEATYEDGVLKPSGPLPLQEHERVEISIQPLVSRVRATQGLIRCDDPELIRKIALDPELDPQEDA